MFPSPRTEWASVEQTIGHAGRDREPHVLARRSSRSGSPFDLDRDAGLERDLEDARSRSSAFCGRWLMMPPLRMAEAAHARVAHRLGHPLRQLVARRRAGPRAARAAPSRARRARRRAGRACRRRGCRTRSPRRTRNGASCSFAAAISSPCRRSASASRPGHDADVRRVVADREVLVAAVARRRRPSRARSPCRPTTSCGSAGRRGCRRARPGGGGSPRERLLAQLGRAARQAERARRRPPRRAPSGSGPSAATYSSEPVARDELRAERVRRRRRRARPACPRP